jgi:AcrR family transcriptional regulator
MDVQRCHDRGDMTHYETPIRSAQAAESRRLILDAAAELFVCDGYAATSLTAIAERAGLAVETIYKHFQSKANLLQRLLQRAFAEDADEADAVDGLSDAQIHTLRAESDPTTRLRRICGLAADVYDRTAAVQRVFAEAAGADPALREQWQTNRRRRVDDVHALLEGFDEDGSLAVPLDEAVDVVWVLAGPEVFAMLTTERGWSTKRYEAWLYETLRAALLASSGG